MNLGQLIQFALGPTEANKVDTAIPQQVFDGMTQAARENIAGWYYSPEAKMFGRLLTKDECWREIRHRLRAGTLKAFIGDTEVSFIADTWACLPSHAQRGEVTFAEAENVVPNR